MVGACVLSYHMIYCFRHCYVFSIKHFQAKVHGSIFCSSYDFGDKALEINQWVNMRKKVFSLEVTMDMPGLMQFK